MGNKDVLLTELNHFPNNSKKRMPLPRKMQLDETNISTRFRASVVDYILYIFLSFLPPPLDDCDNCPIRSYR